MLILVADTNLFFECKPLDELPWHELGSDQVVVLLTKPVLDEIDKHKKGSGRTRDRALKVFSRVRQMLDSSTEEYEVKVSSPKVVLRLASSERADPALSNDLDYSKNDERLIGIAATIAAKEAGHGVRLFTDDTGPAATAHGLGIPYLMISPGWRRPPTETDQAKRIKELERELDAYQSQEPIISIGRPEGANENDKVVVTRKVVAPLRADEIDGVLNALRSKHPLRKDFSPPPTKIETTALGATKTTEYVAPTEDAIRNYRDEAYPHWIANCRKVLANLHEGRDEIEPRVVLRWPISNVGTRPALRVRVEFEVKGCLELRRVSKRNGEDGDSGVPQAPTSSAQRFPLPPVPPKCEERVTHTPALTAPRSLLPADLARITDRSRFSEGRPSHLGRDLLLPPGGSFEAAARLMAESPRIKEQFERLNRAGMHEPAWFQKEQVSAAARAMASLDRFPDRSSILGISAFPPNNAETMRIPMPPIPTTHEPEVFYYDWPLHDSVKRGALTCDLWRHQNDVEYFSFEVLFTKDGEVRGIVECTVHAENLTRPQKAKVLVSRSVEVVSVLEMATAMVAACE